MKFWNWGPTTIWHYTESLAFFSSKSLHPTVQYIHSNTQTVLLTSRSLARKVPALFLTLKLTQEPNNAIRPHEVRLQKGPRGLGLNNVTM